MDKESVLDIIQDKINEINENILKGYKKICCGDITPEKKLIDLILDKLEEKVPFSFYKYLTIQEFMRYDLEQLFDDILLGLYNDVLLEFENSEDVCDFIEEKFEYPTFLFANFNENEKDLEYKEILNICNHYKEKCNITIEQLNSMLNIDNPLQMILKNAVSTLESRIYKYNKMLKLLEMFEKYYPKEV